MEANTDCVTFTREQLYALVWSQPPLKVAAQCGVSDSTVDRVCRRHAIPVPGRRYWQGLTTGKSVSPKPLPKLATDAQNQITFTKRLRVTAPGQLPLNLIRLLKASEELHPLARNSLIALSREPKDAQGLTIPRGTLDIRVTDVQLPRAIRIMDTLVKTLEALGHKVRIVPSQRERICPRWGKYEETEANVKGVTFLFGLVECLERVAHVPTKNEERDLARGQYLKVPRYDYLPTGRLQLRIKDRYLSYVHESWPDGRWKRIEKTLPEFVQYLIAEADTAIRRRQEKELERQRQAEEERQRVEEEGRIKRLNGELAVWRKVQEIRQYVEALAARANGSDDEWISWIRRYADAFDPLRNQGGG
jgi:hypothetical protein